MESDKTKKQYFTFEMLKNKSSLPSTVNTAKLEEYLNPNEFVQQFKMTFEEFQHLSNWKQKEKKKKLDCFSTKMFFQKLLIFLFFFCLILFTIQMRKTHSTVTFVCY